MLSGGAAPRLRATAPRTARSGDTCAAPLCWLYFILASEGGGGG